MRQGERISKDRLTHKTTLKVDLCCSYRFIFLNRSDRSAHSNLFLGFEPLSDLPGVGADTVWRSSRCVLEQRGPALRSDPHQPRRLFYMPTRSHRGQAVHLNVKLWEDRVQ